MSSQSKLWILSNSIFFCYEVVEVGDDISAVEDSEAVLLCNHQSTADTPLIMIVLWPKGMCSGKVMWIMDHIFRFTHFGLMSTIRNDFFIRQVSLSRLISYILSSLWLSLLFFGYIQSERLFSKTGIQKISVFGLLLSNIQGTVMAFWTFYSPLFKLFW